MSITDKKGINVTSGFKLISPQPIDARMVVEDENELVSIVDSAAAYEGQLVYVKSLDKYVSFDGSQFNELETGGGGAYVENETLYLNAAESGSSSGSTGGGGGVVFNSTITGTINADGVLALDTTSSSFIFNTADYIINNFDKIKAITLIIENNILGNYVISPVFAGGSTVGGETIVYKNFQFTIADSVTETGMCILRIYNINECTLSYTLSNFVQYFSGSVFTFKILI